MRVCSLSGRFRGVCCGHLPDNSFGPVTTSSSTPVSDEADELVAGEDDLSDDDSSVCCCDPSPLSELSRSGFRSTCMSTIPQSVLSVPRIGIARDTGVVVV